MNEDAINRHAEAAEREINYTSARNAFAGFGMGLIERSHSRTEIISKHIKAAVDEFLSHQNDDICQTLGKALGFPWYKDDQANFPGTTEENGVCVGDHVAESLAEVAAREIHALRDWKESATSMLNCWDDVWVALGKPGDLGSSKCVESAIEVRRLQNRIADLGPLIDRYGIECKSYGIAIQSLGSDEKYGFRKMRDETKAKIDSILKGTK